MGEEGKGLGPKPDNVPADDPFAPKKDGPRNPADANTITREYFDSILIEERLIDSVKSDISMELFGRHFDTPIMMPAFSHMDDFVKKEPNVIVDYGVAAKNLGAVNFIGMRENDRMDMIFETGAPTVRIIKPYADRDKIFDQIQYAKEHGAFGVGMDIDHIFGNNGEIDIVWGEPMAPQTTEMIKEYVEFAKPLPFVVKGVLSVTDALKCKEAGVQGLLISHHGGRMPYAIPPLVVLPDIREAVGPEMKLFVDCCINRGADVYKAIALGADAVAVGKAMMPYLMEKGHEGVEELWTKMNEELATIMNYTGCATLKDIDESVLYFL